MSEPKVLFVFIGFVDCNRQTPPRGSHAYARARVVLPGIVAPRPELRAAKGEPAIADEFKSVGWYALGSVSVAVVA